MNRVCKLSSELNRCSYLGKEQKCNAPHSNCGMLVKTEEEVKSRSKYIRQPRWYEKYYN